MDRLNKNYGKVLIIDYVHPVLKEKLGNFGFECKETVDITYKELVSEIKGCVGLIIRSRFRLEKDFFDEAKDLVFVGRVGSGLENIDVEYAGTLGIKCINSPEGNRDAVGEHALGLLLALMNKICLADSEIRQGKWLREKNRGYEIMGRTVGIIGYGNTGSAFAQKLSGFEAEIIAYDKYKSGFQNKFVEEVTLEDVFNRADIVSMHVPLKEETTYMVNEEFIGKFKKPVYLINTSRGKVVDTNSLVAGIKSNKIIGAALDVIEYESYSFEKLKPEKRPEALNFLLKSDRVVLSPHVAGVTFEALYKLANVLYEKIEAMWLKNC